jgi:hypothetical protein
VEKFGLAITVGALLACGAFGSLETHHVLTGPPGPPSQGVQIFLQGQPSPPGLHEVAIVQAVGTGNKAKLETVIDGLKVEGQQLGCTAVINAKIDQGSGTASATGTCMR